MAKFILGLVCGVGLTLLTPWAHENVLSDPMKKTTPNAGAAQTPVPQRDWMFDKSRGTLNEAARPTVQ